MMPTEQPGKYLDRLIREYGLTQKRFARHLHVPVTRINEIVTGKRGITADTAWRLEQAVGVRAVDWLIMQAHYDLDKVVAKKPKKITRLVRFE